MRIDSGSSSSVLLFVALFGAVVGLATLTTVSASNNGGSSGGSAGHGLEYDPLTHLLAHLPDQSAGAGAGSSTKRKSAIGGGAKSGASSSTSGQHEVVSVRRVGHGHGTKLMNAHGVAQHPDRIQFALTAFGKEFQLDLDKNHGLLHDDYKEVIVHPETLDVLSSKTKAQVEHCYYIGSVTGDDASSVMVSTCAGPRGTGVQGVIHAHGDTFAILPVAHAPAHVTNAFRTKSGLQTADRRSGSTGSGKTGGSTGDASGGDDMTHLIYRDRAYTGLKGRTCGNTNSGSPTAIPTTSPRSSFTNQVQPRTGSSTSSSSGGGKQHSGATTMERRAVPQQQDQAAANAADALNPMGRQLLTTCSGGQYYVEAHIVNNYARYLTLGNSTTSDTLAIANIVSTRYGTTQFRQNKCVDVKLRGQLVWSGNSDPSAIQVRKCNTADPQATAYCGSSPGCYLNTPTSGSMCSGGNLLSTAAYEYDISGILRTFATWAYTTAGNRNKLQTLFGSNLDNIHLFTQYDMAAAVIGLATLGGMCGTSSAGVEQMTFTPLAHATTYAHEMGHNFAMLHDVHIDENDVQKWIMDPFISSPPATLFSWDSIGNATAWLNTGANTCLGNANTPMWNPNAPVCGNGILEFGEQCDAGIVTDAGCSATCQFVSGWKCSATQPCCTGAGLFATAGTSCRPARDATCDLAETCNGRHGLCPVDTYASFGTACTDSGITQGCPTTPHASFCWRGSCALSRSSQCPYCPTYPNAYGNDDSTSCSQLHCIDPVQGGLAYPDGNPIVNDGNPCGGAGNRLSKACLTGVCIDSVTPSMAVAVTGGASKLINGTYTVSWTTTGTPSPLSANVRIYKQQGTNSAALLATVPSTGPASYAWDTTGNAPASDWFIRVDDAYSPSFFTYSTQFALSNTPPVNSCATNNNGCDSLVVCTFADGEGTCGPCPTGYTGTGQTPNSCLDVNECATANGGCSITPAVGCTNTPGSRTCGACPTGYTGTGVGNCVDVNECATNNGGCVSVANGGVCTNTVGNRTCACATGFIGSGYTVCADINECATNRGGCDVLTNCTNTVGSRTCSACPAGYYSSASNTGAAPCTQDPCTLITCVNGGTCVNQGNGVGACMCASGFSGTTCAEPVSNVVAVVSNALHNVTIRWLSSSTAAATTFVVKIYISTDALPVYTALGVANSGQSLQQLVISADPENRWQTGAYLVRVATTAAPTTYASVQFSISNACLWNQPCAHSGTCQASDSLCVCVLPWRGGSCTDNGCAPAGDTTGTICSGHGTCALNNNGGGDCTCSTGFQGTYCEASLSCSVVCGHGGSINAGCSSGCTCDNTDGSMWTSASNCHTCGLACVNGGSVSTTQCTSCVCATGYGGTLCDMLRKCFTMRLSVSYSTALSYGAQFTRSFANDIAVALGISASLVTDVAIADAGQSTLVNFCLTASTVDGVTALTNYQTTLNTQAASSTSALSHGDTTSTVDASYGVPEQGTGDDGSSGLPYGEYIGIVAAALGAIIIVYILYRCCCAAKPADKSGSTNKPAGKQEYGVAPRHGSHTEMSGFTNVAHATDGATPPSGNRQAHAPSQSVNAHNVGRPVAYSAVPQQPPHHGRVGSSVTGTGQSSWTQQHTEDGRMYWWNDATGASSWVTPPEILAAGQQNPALLWSEQRSPDGRVYWWNSATGESSWTKPHDVATAGR